MTDTPLGLDAELYGDRGPIDEQQGPWDEPEPPRDLSQVDWHMRRANALDAEMARIKALFDEEIARLERRRDDLIGKLERMRQWHTEAVEAWHRREHAAGRASKTMTLPHGKSTLVKPQIAVEVVDEEALRGWAVVNDKEDVLWPPKDPPLSKKTLKALAKPSVEKPEPGSRVDAVDWETGEVVPGVVYRQSRDRHDVKGAD